MASSVVGVDIGSAGLRAVEVLDPDKARPTLLRFHAVQYHEGAVSRGEVIEPHTVASALRVLWSEGGFKSKKVVLGMGNQRVLARDLSVAKMSMRRIRESLPFQVQELLPVPVADALLDFYPISESDGEHGPMVHGLLIAAVKEAVTANVSAVQLAGLTPVDVDLIPFALTRLLVTRPGVAGTVAVVDIGASTTSVVIASEGVPQFVRIIPAGGGDLTDALKGRLEIDDVQAENLKRGLGLAREVRSQDEQRVVEIIYEVAGELLGSLRNTLHYYTNTRSEGAVGRIVMAGGAAGLPGLVAALSDLTRIPAEIGDPFTTVAVSKDLTSQDLRLNQSNISVALGLALGSAA